jgi:hypothetical protein
MNFLLKRLQEPSSRLGIGSVVAGVAQVIDNPTNVTGWSLIIGGLYGFFTPEVVKDDGKS